MSLRYRTYKYLYDYFGQVILKKILHIDDDKPEQNMDWESLRELKYRERERKTIEIARRQALLEIQEQKQVLANKS